MFFSFHKNTKNLFFISCLAGIPVVLKDALKCVKKLTKLHDTAFLCALVYSSGASRYVLLILQQQFLVFKAC